MIKDEVWSNEEENFIINNYKNMSDKAIAKKLNRSVNAVSYRRTKLKCKRRQYKSWTLKEIRFLQEYHTKLTPYELANKLNRSPGSVITQMTLLGVSRLSKADKKQYALYKGDQIITIGTIDEISKSQKLKKGTLLSYKTPNHIRKTGKSIKKVFEVKE